jgi:hypothetical protein
MNIAKIAYDSWTSVPCGLCRWFGKRVLCATDHPGKVTQNAAQGVAVLTLGLIHPYLLAVSAVVILVKIKNILLLLWDMKTRNEI